jgi:hypothetical protein
LNSLSRCGTTGAAVGIFSRNTIRAGFKHEGKTSPCGPGRGRRRSPDRRPADGAVGSQRLQRHRFQMVIEHNRTGRLPGSRQAGRLDRKRPAKAHRRRERDHGRSGIPACPAYRAGGPSGREAALEGRTGCPCRGHQCRAPGPAHGNARRPGVPGHGNLYPDRVRRHRWSALCLRARRPRHAGAVYEGNLSCELEDRPIGFRSVQPSGGDLDPSLPSSFASDPSGRNLTDAPPLCSPRSVPETLPSARSGCLPDRLPSEIHHCERVVPCSETRGGWHPPGLGASGGNGR